MLSLNATSVIMGSSASDRHEESRQDSENLKSPPSRTLHLIIDEAHNILSEQSTREHEIWKDYRLELFEEIIKEGRKYGVYLTLSRVSGRPTSRPPSFRRFTISSLTGW